MIKVTLEPGENDDGNDFVDTKPASISGSVKNSVGDPLLGVTIDLLDGSGALTGETTTTDELGFYEFTDLLPGNYIVKETNPDDFPLNVRDYDTTGDGDSEDLDDGSAPDDMIKVTLEPGEDDDGNDFVDQAIATILTQSISGSVKDNFGSPLSEVTIELLDGSGGSTGKITLTDDFGFYEFNSLNPGMYIVKETNLPSHPVDVSDYDTMTDSDPDDNDFTVDNEIKVTLNPDEADEGNDFVDAEQAAISGTVKNNFGVPLSGVEIVLQDTNGNIMDSTTTRLDGSYEFEVAPGDYVVVETNPTEYPENISDHDNTNDGDSMDDDRTVDNKIEVSIGFGEIDDGNDFVDYDPRGDVPCGGVVITEIMYDPSPEQGSDKEGEWIELFNHGKYFTV